MRINPADMTFDEDHVANSEALDNPLARKPYLGTLQLIGDVGEGLHQLQVQVLNWPQFHAAKLT